MSDDAEGAVEPLLEIPHPAVEMHVTNGAEVDLSPWFGADATFKEPYEIVIPSKPARFFYEANFVVAVHPGGFAEQAGLLPYSRIVKVNDLVIGPDLSFDEAYHSTPAPLKLTAQQSHKAPDKKGMFSGSTSKPVISRSALIGLMIVYASVLIDWFGALMALPVLPFLAQSLDLSNSQLGLIIGVYQLAAIPGGLITLKIAQARGTKFGILYSIIGSSITLLVVSFAWDFYSLLVFRALAGLTGNSVPVAITHIGSVVPEHLKPRYFSYVGLMITLSLVVGPAFGGALVNYGVARPFQVGAGLAFLGFVFAMFMLPNVLVPPKTKEDPGKLSGQNVASLVVSFFKSFTYTATIAMSGNYHLRRFGLSGQDVGLIFTSHGVLVSLNTALIFPLLSRALGSYHVYTLGYLLMGVGYAAAAFMPTWWSFQLCLSLLCGLGYGYAMNSVSPISDRWVTPTSRAKVHSYSAMLDSLGYALGAVLWGEVYEQGEQMNFSGLLWLVAGGTGLLVTVISMALFCCVFKQAESRRKKDDDKQSEHRYANFRQEPGTEADFLRMGKLVGTLLHKRNYKWVSHMYYLQTSLEKFYPPLPTDTVENHMRATQMLQYQADLAQQAYRNDQDIFDGLFLDVERGPGIRSV